MNSIKRRLEKLERMGNTEMIDSLEDFWREVALYSDAIERGEADEWRDRPVNVNLLRALLQGVRECEQELERRLAKGESNAQLNEEMQLMRDIRQGLEHILNAS
jgi:hypothetical protein